MPLDQMQSESRSMSFGDHLEELRSRVFKSVAVLFPLAIALFFLAPYLREALCQPLFDALRANGQPAQVQSIAPAETLMVEFKLSIIGAIIVGAPWILFQIWKFIGPGLYSHEKRFVHFLVPASFLLTAVGVSLFYFIMLPFTLIFLVGWGAPVPKIVDGSIAGEIAAGPSMPVLAENPQFPQPGQMWVRMPDQVLCIAVSNDLVAQPLTSKIVKGTESAVQGALDAVLHSADAPAPAVDPTAPITPTRAPMRILEIALGQAGGVQPNFRLEDYTDFALLLLAGVVVAFQMPLAILLLGWIGLVDVAMLRKKRKIALFVMAIIAAVVTPPDATSMFIMLVPLYSLYELGIILLVYLPASRIREGSLFRFSFSKKRTSSTDNATRQPAQTERSSQQDQSSRSVSSGQSEASDPDAGSTDEDGDRGIKR
ncbi:MAG: preprotein translocase subunit TatC [Phycisphaerales bacterium]|nr:preprotein translocase subunit TatC [Phycisphaerales bacterium]